MKKWRKLSVAIAMAFIMSVIVPAILPNQFVAVAQAATVKLNKTKLTLEVGKSYTLKISGTKSKVTWSSSDKTIATVSSKGVVKAKKAGKATITAKVGSKKYKCTVTVKKAATTDFLKNAPFDAQEITFANFKAVIPASWEATSYQYAGMDMVVLVPKGAAATGTSNITIVLGALLEDDEVSEESIKAALEQLGDDIKLSNMVVSEVDTTLGKATKVSYDVEYSIAGLSGKFSQELYQITLKDSALAVTLPNMGDSNSAELKEVAAYLMKSIQKVK